MRYCDSIFGRLLEPISRRRFAAIVERHEGDAYDKSFKSWDHLVALVFAQLSHTDTLRGLELAPDELQISIEGKATGFGMAQSDEFVDRVQTSEKLILRTIERKMGRPFMTM